MMRQAFSVLCLLSLAACGSEEDGPPSDELTQGNTDPSARQFTPDPDASVPLPSMGFEYVSIASLRAVNAIGGEMPPESDFPGADLDAVELRRADGTSLWATEVEVSKEMAGSPDATLGAPGEGCESFASLGDSGSLRLKFAQRIMPGDTIVIHEVDASDCGDEEPSGERFESYYVFVGIPDMPEGVLVLGPRGGNEGSADLPVEP